jgi:general secretion pathway protein E
MARANDNFAERLRARLDGECAALFGQAGACSPAAARQAGVRPEAIAASTAEALGIEFTESLAHLPASHDFLSRVPIGFARSHCLLGLAGENGSMRLAMADLAQWPQIRILTKAIGRPVVPLFAPREEILRAVSAAYETQTGQAEQVIQELDKDEVFRELSATAQSEDLLDVANRAPVIKLVNLILFEAVKRRASDVHIQPYEDSLVVRLRLDGVLYDVFQPPKALQEEITSRIKVMGGMNIAERRLPQDGRATVEVGNRVIDLRIATLPTHVGERVVIRLLDKSARLYTLDELGMPAGVLGKFRRLVHQDHGIILVTGPTGSGKTTTLYAALQEIDATEFNILTLEDPIEYRLKGISQTQINEKKGMTFATGLRHVLRQDPDVIMVGEIRDTETARMAIQSALTGHLVFSTLHTNDASGAIARLLDLGAEPYLVASCLLGVLAQRLVRRICPVCRMAHEPTEEDLARWALSEADGPLPGPLFRGQGCEECMNTGYRERVGIFELLTVNEALRELVLHRAKASTIKAEAIQGGMRTLRTEGLEKVTAGVTTIDEVVKVTSRDEF